MTDPAPPVALEPTPGFYRWRARRRAPPQPVRVVHNEDGWFVLLAGEVQPGGGASDPLKVPFLLRCWPLHPIDEAEYDALLRARETAAPGSPILTPDQPTDLRKAPPLW